MRNLHLSRPPFPVALATPGRGRATRAVAVVLGVAVALSAALPAQAATPTASIRTVVVAKDLTSYVTAVYSDLFGRAPDPTGLSTWGQALAARTPRVAVANAITSSAEYRRGLISGAYAEFLGRSPDSAGLQNWLGAMGAGLTIQSMEAGFVASDEYFGRAGGTPSGWVAALYRDVLGRSASAAEAGFWTTQLGAGASRTAVATGFLLSTEHLRSVIDGYYWKLLDRGIDPSGQATWVHGVQGGTRIEMIIGGIVASDEYYFGNGGPVIVAAPAPGLLAGQPGASNTGVPAGVSLKASGSLIITTNGAVIDGLDITGTVVVNADNVVIRNTRINNTGLIPLRSNGVNLVVEDSEIDGQGGGNPAVAFHNYTLRRVNIHDVAEGPRVNGDVTIEYSYLHHMVQVGSNHTDAIQSTGGSNIVLRGNRIEVRNLSTGTYGNAAFQFGEESAPIRNCLVEGNLLGGGNLTVNGGGGGTTGAQCTFRNNRFLNDSRYGPSGNLGPNVVWDSSNVWDSTGMPV